MSSTFQTQQFIKAQQAKGIPDDRINDYLRKKGINPLTPTQRLAGKGEVNFWDRLKLSFGDDEARERRKAMETQAGLSGRFDIGDIADIAGSIPSLAGFIGGSAIGGTLGAAGGPVGIGVGTAAGAGVGAAYGETLRQSIGKILGTQKEFEPKEIAKEAAIGAVVPPALKLGVKSISLVARGLGSFTKSLAGAVSGKGTDVINKALMQPKIARIGLKANEVQLLKQTATKLRTSVSEITKKAGDDYSLALKKVEEGFADIVNFPNRTQLFRTARHKLGAGQDLITLTLKGVKSKITKDLRKFGVVVDRAKDRIDFAQSPFVGSEEKVLTRIFGIINKWKDLTPIGLNKLAIKVGRFRKTGLQSAELNNVVDSVKRNIRGYVGDRIPDIKALNLKFAEKQNFLEAIRGELNIKGAIDSTSGIIKTSKKLANIFGRNKELARDLVTELEGGVGRTLALEAGRQLGEPVTRQTLSIRGLLQTAIPPRVIGEMTTITGIVKQKISPIFKALQKLEPAERVAIFELLSQSTKDQNK